MAVLSAQDSDKHINQVGPKFFKAFPNIKALSKVNPDTIGELLSNVRNFDNKSKWLCGIATQIKKDKNIPLTLDELTGHSRIGRKSANEIKREAGTAPVTIIADLHVVRVAPKAGNFLRRRPQKN